MRLRFGEFAVDIDRRELYRRAERVHLKPKAYQLLEYLLQRRPKVVSRQELEDHLWPDAHVSPGTLHELVYEIRRALEDGRRTIIRTAHGTGFSFAAEAGGTPSGYHWVVALDDRKVNLLEGENLVGRDLDAQVRIDDPSVSRRHARITIKDAQATLEDLNSKNGTRIEAKPVREPTIIKDGDRIEFGSILVRITTSASLPSTESIG